MIIDLTSLVRIKRSALGMLSGTIGNIRPVYRYYVIAPRSITAECEDVLIRELKSDYVVLRTPLSTDGQAITHYGGEFDAYDEVAGRIARALPDGAVFFTGEQEEEAVTNSGLIRFYARG